MNTSSLLGSAHRDVLEAPIPEDDSAARQRLLEECKNRGRAAVGAKAWRDALMLYEKALECSLLEKEKAILQSNTSLVQRNMGNFEAARQAAQIATQEDPTYVKGWWRLGQALQSLHQPEEALKAMERASQLEPQNKALQKECKKLQDQLQEEQDLMQVDERLPTEEKNNNKTVVVSKSSSNTTKKKTPSSTTTKTTEEDDEDEEKLFTKSEHVKGYKIVNGKKTSYFHKELSEEDKRLIGDIQPKKLDSAAAATTTTTTNKDTSAWNQAGTWEERDASAWAKQSLKERLLATSYTLESGAVAKVSKVVTCDGTASTATVRGKKRYLHEFHLLLEWKLMEEDDDEELAAGSMEFPDVDGTCELGEGYELSNFSVTRVEEASLRPLLERFVHKEGLRNAIHTTLDDWVRHFRETY